MKNTKKRLTKRRAIYLLKLAIESSYRVNVNGLIIGGITIFLMVFAQNQIIKLKEINDRKETEAQALKVTISKDVIKFSDFIRNLEDEKRHRHEIAGNYYKARGKS